MNSTLNEAASRADHPHIPTMNQQQRLRSITADVNDTEDDVP